MKRNRKSIYRLFVLSLALIMTVIFISTLIACTNTTDTLSNLDTVCFEKDVLPIFQTNCAISGCHNDNSEELKLTNYNSIREKVKPFNANDSKIYTSITNTWGEFMPPPPRQPLSKEQRTLIYVWIQQGAKNISCQ